MYFIHFIRVALSYISVFAQLFTLQIFCLTGLSWHLLLPPYSQPWRSPPTIFQLPSAMLRRQHHITFNHSAVSHYLSTIKTVFFLILFFSQHALFLLEFSRVWFCKILRTFNSHWLLWNIKMPALCGTYPLSLHSLCNCKLSMSLSCYTVRMCSSLDIPGAHFDSKYFNGTI